MKALEYFIRIRVNKDDRLFIEKYVYATFLPQALQPGFALCTLSIIEAFKGAGAGLGAALILYAKLL